MKGSGMGFLFPTAVRSSSLICLAWDKKEPPKIFLESVPYLSLSTIYIIAISGAVWGIDKYQYQPVFPAAKYRGSKDAFLLYMQGFLPLPYTAKGK
jgi:hypothetical protein